MALSLGIREGEALGLRWQDVDLDERIVRIRVQLQLNPLTKELELVELKSSRSRRSINLPDFAVRALREHRTRQLEERLRVGEAWTDWKGAGLVFTSELGMPISGPRDLRRLLTKLRNAAELPALRFHDTRHTCATLLLVQGVSERVVMEILGHTDLKHDPAVHPRPTAAPSGRRGRARHRAQSRRRRARVSGFRDFGCHFGCQAAGADAGILSGQTAVERPNAQKPSVRAQRPGLSDAVRPIRDGAQ